MTIPAIIDSTGNPGIPPPLTLDVVVVVVVLVVEVSESKVEATELVIRLVDVVTVDTIVDVEVAVNKPPKGANLSIVASGIVSGISVLLKSGGDPTIHPMLGEIM